MCRRRRKYGSGIGEPQPIRVGCYDTGTHGGGGQTHTATDVGAQRCGWSKGPVVHLGIPALGIVKVLKARQLMGLTLGIPKAWLRKDDLS